jgi:aminoglycoside phosphotransferase family enzyme
MPIAMTAESARQAGDPGLAAKVAFLSQPGAYPETTARVVRVETHMSWVFLLDANAYKLKKPARLPYLDFSTLARRKFFCDEELRLNRRLSDGVYLDVVPLTMGADGMLRVGGAAGSTGGGDVVDWLVHMRRLPAERMLDRMIIARSLGEDALRRAVGRLAHFYRAAPPVPMAPADYRARFAAAIRQNRDELVKPRYGLDAGEVEATFRRQLEALERHATILDGRAAAGRVVEGHGDLRPEHVCLEAQPQFIDCLEFSRELRVLDPVDELAFLALECKRLGAPWARECIFRTYADATGDAPPEALVSFYQSYRAGIRARIAAWHLDDPSVQLPAKWIARAGEYLRLARAANGAPAPC